MSVLFSTYPKTQQFGFKVAILILIKSKKKLVVFFVYAICPAPRK